MVNMGDDHVNVLNIPSGDDVSDTSCLTEIVYLKMSNVVFLAVHRPIVNLITLSDSSGSGGVFIEDGNEL